MAARPALLASLVAAMLALGTTAGPTSATAPQQRGTSSACHSISGPFRARGAAILDPHNRRYVPYGINLVGLAKPSTDPLDDVVASEKRRIAATRLAWCANTVRIQVSEDAMVDGDGYLPDQLQADPDELAAVKSLVAYARAQHLVVVLNLQVHSDPAYYPLTASSPIPMPTARSLVFWDAMAAVFGSNPDVIFDLFNEPGGLSTGCVYFACLWDHWRNGFSQGGVTYYGMQQVAARLRARGARNLLWVEGKQAGADLSGMWPHHLTGVGAVAYAEHRPTGAHTVARWRRLFGYLAERNLAPVVNGEWTNYARGAKGDVPASWACWSDAPTTLPRWFEYLRTRHIGLVATKLEKGVLVRTDSESYDQPTQLHADWSCKADLDQGAGQAIMSWFTAQNTRPPALVVLASHIGSLRLARSGGHGWRITAVVRRDVSRWPAHPVRLQRHVGSRWVTVAHRRTDGAGRVVFTYAPKGRITASYRLTVAAATGYRASRSRTFRLHSR